MLLQITAAVGVGVGTAWQVEFGFCDEKGSNLAKGCPTVQFGYLLKSLVITEI